MPVHIYYQHIQRNLISIKIINQVTELFIRIQPIARPPIAKRIAGRQRHLTCKESVVFQSLLVIMPVSHEIPVLSSIGGTFFRPLPVRIVIEQKSLRIINKRPAIGSQQTIFQFQLFPFLGISYPGLSLRFTIHSVQSAVSTFQISFLLHSGLPSEWKCPFHRFNHQIISGKPTTVFFITHPHLRSRYFNPRPF